MKNTTKRLSKKDYFVGKNWTKQKKPIPLPPTLRDNLIKIADISEKFQANSFLDYLAAEILGYPYRDDRHKHNMSQVELYKNIIQMPNGVHLCIKENFDKDQISLEIIIPTRHFSNQEGKDKIVDALHNVAMYIQSLD